MLENLDLEVIRDEIRPDLLRVENDDAAIESLLVDAAPALRMRGPGFWANIREQFVLFLCTDDPVYAEERTAFRRRGREATPILMGMLTGAIIAALGGGVLINTLAPFVALLLYAAAKMGKEAFCQTYCPAATT